MKVQSTAEVLMSNVYKSDNLQYNRLGRWDDRLINKVSDVPSIIIFHNFLQISLTKIETKGFECSKSKLKSTVLFSIYQNNTWTIRHLADEMIDPVTQHIILKIVGFPNSNVKSMP